MNYLKSYAISFIAGLFGALVIVFSTEGLHPPKTGLFVVWAIILFLSGVAVLSFINYFQRGKK